MSFISSFGNNISSPADLITDRIKKLNQITKDDPNNLILQYCKEIEEILWYGFDLKQSNLERNDTWELFYRIVLLSDIIQDINNTSVNGFNKYKAKIEQFNTEKFMKAEIVNYFQSETIWPEELIVYLACTAYREMTDPTFDLRSILHTLNILFIKTNK